jgi:transposase-like protein
MKKSVTVTLWPTGWKIYHSNTMSNWVKNLSQYHSVQLGEKSVTVTQCPTGWKIYHSNTVTNWVKNLSQYHSVKLDEKSVTVTLCPSQVPRGPWWVNSKSQQSESFNCYLRSVIMIVNVAIFLRDLGSGPRCSWGLHSSAMLRGVGWWLITDVSGKLVV